MLTIDADAHVLENPHTWDFLEESEEGFRPEVVVSGRQYTKAEMRDKWDRMPKRGAEYWFVDGRLQPKNHNVGQDTTPETREMRDVEARLRHMDESGSGRPGALPDPVPPSGDHESRGGTGALQELQSLAGRPVRGHQGAPALDRAAAVPDHGQGPGRAGPGQGCRRLRLHDAWAGGR